MRCPHCHNDNPPHLTICDWCGSSLITGGDHAAQPGAPAAVSNPGEKRKTMYEPSSPPSNRRSTQRPPADDFFGSPPPPRPTPPDPDDPFAQSIRPRPPEPRAPEPRAPEPRAPKPATRPHPQAPPPQAAQPVAPSRSARPHSRTIIENPAQSSGRKLRGALFIFTGSNGDGVIAPLYEGRNSLGRAEDRDVVLEDGRVSGEHGFLFMRQDRHSYVDTSTNGSRIDGRVVYGEQVEVNSGSVLEMGNLRIVLVTIPPEALNE